MSPKQVVREFRRSTRVSLKVMIEAKGLAEPLACDGETHVVNLHGALISTAVALHVGMEVEIHVILTDKRAAARVVYVDPDQPRHCGLRYSNHRIFGDYLYHRMTGRQIIWSDIPSGPRESIRGRNLQNRCR